jgi:hypothetical protein
LEARVAATDHHTALRSEVLAKTAIGSIEIVLVKLQSSKDDLALTLHVSPSTFNISGGLQPTDWLRFLGFKESAHCQFANARQCLSKEVPEGYDLPRFVTALSEGFGPEHLWGKNLTAFLDEIYRNRAKFCVVFVSAEYKERKWTIHELRSAQAKALEQKGEEYILPVKVDDTELEGLPPNVAYVGISLGIERIAELLIKKLKG